MLEKEDEFWIKEGARVNGSHTVNNLKGAIKTRSVLLFDSLNSGLLMMR